MSSIDLSTNYAFLPSALSNAALLIAAPSLGCLTTYTKVLTDLFKTYHVPVPDLTHILEQGHPFISLTTDISAYPGKYQKRAHGATGEFQHHHTQQYQMDSETRLTPPATTIIAKSSGCKKLPHSTTANLHHSNIQQCELTTKHEPNDIKIEYENLEFNHNCVTDTHLEEYTPAQSMDNTLHKPSSKEDKCHSSRKPAPSTMTSVLTPPAINQYHIPSDVHKSASTATTSSVCSPSPYTPDTVFVPGYSRQKRKSSIIDDVSSTKKRNRNSKTATTHTVCTSTNKRTRIYHPPSRLVDKLAMEHMPDKLSSTRVLRCVVCYKHKTDDKKNHIQVTSYECMKCKVPICPPHKRGCWKIYHTEQDF